VNCEELIAKIKSQKAALLRLQAEEMAYYARLRGGTDPDQFANQTSASGAFSDYLDAKAAYERAARAYAAAVGGGGVRG